MSNVVTHNLEGRYFNGKTPLPHPPHHRADRVALLSGPGREHHCTYSLTDWPVS